MVSKFLKTILIFSVMLLIGYSVLLVFCNSFLPSYLTINIRKPNGSYLEERLDDVKKIHDVDILFLGASTSYMDFDTRKFQRAGLITFNLGSGAQTPEQTNILIKRYISKLNPRLVVYEVLPGMMSRDGIEASMELIMADNLDKEIFRLISRLEPNIKIYNLLILKAVYSIFSSKLTPEALSDNNRIYLPGGYVQSPMSFNEFKDRSEYKHLRTWGGREDQLNALDNNLQILEDRSVPVLLVRAPITSYKYNSIANNDYIDSLFQTKGTYINFQNKLSLNDKLHFLDNTHLNQEGVEIFNSYLMNYIQKEFSSTNTSEK